MVSSFTCTNNLSSWNDFLLAIQVRFGKWLYDDPMQTLSKRKQTNSLEDYKTQFEVLANRVHRLIDPQKLICFLGGWRMIFVYQFECLILRH